MLFFLSPIYRSTPGIFFGRNNDVTFGVTYGFMDQIDFFFERVQNGKYLREVETTDEQGNKVGSSGFSSRF